MAVSNNPLKSDINALISVAGAFNPIHNDPKWYQLFNVDYGVGNIDETTAPIMMWHGEDDDIVWFTFAEQIQEKHDSLSKTIDFF